MQGGLDEKQGKNHVGDDRLDVELIELIRVDR